MLTAQDVYSAAQSLSLPERLRLAALLIEGLHQNSLPQNNLAHLAGYSDAWTEEDREDFRRSSARYLLAESVLEEEQDDALPPLEDLLRMKAEQDLESERV